MVSPSFPAVEDSDPDDISWALETGNATWSQGDHREGLRWLKKAAESASEAGDDMRSLMLAKAAAELRSWVEEQIGPLSQAPPSGPQAESAESAGPPRSVPAPSQPTSAAPPPRPPSVTPAARSANAMPPPPKPGSSPPSAPEVEESDEGRPTLVQPVPKRFLPAAIPSAARSTPAPAIDRREAARVSLQPVEGSPGVYLVRAMRPGDRPGPGMRAALLISDDDAPLF